MLVFWFRWFTRRTEPNVGLIVGFAAGLWRPHGDSNPGYRRERATNNGIVARAGPSR
jgi:hypothetical protein